MSDLVGNPDDRFSHNEAHLNCCVTKPIIWASSPAKTEPGHLPSLIRVFSMHQISRLGTFILHKLHKLNVVAQKRSGKPRKSWNEVIKNDRKKLDMDSADPQNRSEWRG